MWLEFSCNPNHGPQIGMFRSLFWKYTIKQEFLKGKKKKQYFGQLVCSRCNNLFEEGREKYIL